MMEKYSKSETFKGAFRKLENEHNWFVRLYGNIAGEIGGWLTEQAMKYGDMYEYVGRDGRNPND